MRFCSGPFPPPFSGHRRRRVGGTIPEEETAQGRTGLGRSAEGTARRPQAPSGSLKLPSTDPRVPSLSPLSGLPFKPLVSSLPLTPVQIPALLLTRKNPASILLPRSEIAPYPSVHRAAATEGGTGRGEPSAGMLRAPLRAPHLRGPAAAPAQFSERPTRVRKLTGALRLFAKRGGESGGLNQWRQEGESWSRPTLQSLLWRVISLVRAAGVDPSFDP